MEAECEADEEQNEYDDELKERLKDVGEHDDIDAKSGKLADDEYELEPGKEYSNYACLPLPNLSESIPAISREWDNEKK